MGILKIREVLGELPSQSKSNPVLDALRRDFEEETVVLAQIIRHRNDAWRMKCKIIEVNDLYALFQSIGSEGTVSGSIDKITVSYEPMMSLKMYTIAPVI
jgi:hypothetical protein